MNVLVVGGGGREHALGWKLAQSPRCTRLFATRPNAGLAAIAEAVDLAPDDIPGLVSFARAAQIGMTVVGPEAPLAGGLVDAFREAGLRIWGPVAAAAELEGSKAFAKALMTRAGIPTAAYATFESLEPAVSWVREFGRPVAVKADGLAAGKGVVLCSTPEEAEAALREMLVDHAFGGAGARVVVEELLVGEEASFIALCDGDTVLPLASSQDHKRVGDADTGPNTGGMGAYSPAPVVTTDLAQEIMDRVMRPTVNTLAAEGIRFTGFLYAGIMVTADGPKVLEFNVRLGDPETQPLMSRLRSDLVEVFEAGIDGCLCDLVLDWDPRPALCVVMASEGYPRSAARGDVITGVEAADALNDVCVFQAGTSRDEQGHLVTAGGRVLSVTGLGEDLAAAQARAYEGVAAIRWRGEHHRSDIGWRALP